MSVVAAPIMNRPTTSASLRPTRSPKCRRSFHRRGEPRHDRHLLGEDLRQPGLFGQPEQRHHRGRLPVLPHHAHRRAHPSPRHRHVPAALPRHHHQPVRRVADPQPGPSCRSEGRSSGSRRRARTCPRATAICWSWPRTERASVMQAGSRWNFRSIDGRRPGRDRPPRWIATSPAWGWSRCPTAIPLTGGACHRVRQEGLGLPSRGSSGSGRSDTSRRCTGSHHDPRGYPRGAPHLTGAGSPKCGWARTARFGPIRQRAIRRRHPPSCGYDASASAAPRQQPPRRALQQPR